MNASLKGAGKSVTMWAAGLIAGLSEIMPIITPDTLTSLGLHAPTVQKIGVGAAVVMAVCRVITKNSLADKGTTVQAGVLPQAIAPSHEDASITVIAPSPPSPPVLSIVPVTGVSTNAKT